MYKIRFIWIGKTQEAYLKTGIEQYLTKIRRYVELECLELKPASYAQGQPHQWKLRESESIAKKIDPSETTVLLDEKGQQKSSVQCAEWMEKEKMSQHLRINFVIGGAYGIDPTPFSNPRLMSFSKMTFTHQMVRLILAEQVYRAFTIMNREPYHNEG